MRGAQRLARLVDRGRIGRRCDHRQVRLAGRVEQQRLERVVGRLVLQRPLQRLGVALLADLVGLAGGARPGSGRGPGPGRLPSG